MPLHTKVSRHGARTAGCNQTRKTPFARMNLGAIRRFLAADDGPTAVEYGVMLMLIFAVCLSAVSLIGQKTQGSFSTSANSINKAITTAS